MCFIYIFLIILIISFINYYNNKKLGRRLTRVTGDVRSPEHLLQRLSVAVQRGNSAAVMGTAMCATAV